MRPTLHLTVGLPGVGKTTLARRLAADNGGVRLTPDEWMAPLFGESDAGGRRDVLEGRFLWLAREALRVGTSVILDFGCWSPEERYAIRVLAEAEGAHFALHLLTLGESERRRRTARRWRESPGETFEMTDADHERFLALVRLPSEDELGYGTVPDPPAPHPTWAAWTQDRWPTSAGTSPGG